jgi:hypothetical protein
MVKLRHRDVRVTPDVAAVLKDGGLPAIGLAGLEFVLVTEIRDRHPFD